MGPRLLAVLSGAATLMAACGGTSSASRAPTASSSPTTSAAPASGGTPSSSSPATSAPATLAPGGAGCSVGTQAPPRATIAANTPTALAFAPDGRLFYAERSGTVRVYQSGASRVFATVQTVTSEAGGGYSERGLLGLAVSPTFAADRFVYAFYSTADRVHQDVIRWTDCGGRGINPARIVELPAGPDCCHKGGRLAFGPDGKLYVTLGEEHQAPFAQNLTDVRGKILRYNPDGSVPPDNPFGVGNAVWSYGFRNPFGIAFSPAGQLAVTSNGPTGDAGSPGTGFDTVVAAVNRGSGHQWPNCYGYSHALAPANSCGTGQPGPDWSSEASTVVPTGAAFVDGSGPSAYANHLVFCTFDSGMKILSAGQPHATVQQGPSECRLDVKQGPDHALYYSDTGHIYRAG